MEFKFDWSAAKRYDDPDRMAQTQRVPVNEKGTPVLVVISHEAIEEGITETQIRSIAEKKIRRYATGRSLIPSEVIIGTEDLEP